MTFRSYRALRCMAAVSLASRRGGLERRSLPLRRARPRRTRRRAFRFSRDGQWIAYAVGTPIPDENRTASAIWLAPVGRRRSPGG